VPGSIVVLWLLLGPPQAVAPAEPAEAAHVVEIQPAPPPEPAPTPSSAPAIAPEQAQPRQPPPDDLYPPPPPPHDDHQVRQDQTLKLATKRVRGPRRGPRDRTIEPTGRTRDMTRLRGKPWGGSWRKWGAPLLSGLGLPGLGQLANGHVLKGVGLIYGTIGLVAGTVLLYRADHDGSRAVGAEYVRLGAYGVVSTALPLMWVYAIADAWRWAHDKDEITPKLEHRLRITAARSFGLGFRADPSRPGFYDEWTVSLIGQVAPRWSFGVSDVSIKPDGQANVGVVQFGLRAGYRVYAQRRFWIDASLGIAMQVHVHRPAAPLDPDAPTPATSRNFGAIPYGQLDLRYFVLDRLSLDLTPRISVPLTTRWFSAERALPRYAPSLELGASATLYFF
jgi:hypothetical protein